MLYAEWVNKQGSGVFETMNELYECQWLGDHDPIDVDLAYQSLYSMKRVPKNIEVLAVEEVANMLFLLYNDIWEHMSSQYVDIDLSHSSRLEIDQTIDNTQSENSSVSGVNRVNAYDSNSLIDTDQNESEGDVNRQGSNSLNRTEQRSNPQMFFQNLSQLRSNSLFKQIFNDVASVVSLNIH